MDPLAPKRVLDIKTWMNGSSGMHLFVRTMGFLGGAFIASSGNRIDRITVANYKGVFGEWITFALGLAELLPNPRTSFFTKWFSTEHYTVFSLSYQSL
jgi:hypothetical protein